MMSYRGHVKDGVVVLDPPGALPDGTEVRVDPLSPSAEPSMLDAAAFWKSMSFEQLAATQRVTVPQSFEEVLGGWPDDEIDDGFEDAIRDWRQADREHHG